MELSELTAYANEKYHITEQRKWADFPGFSVLSHPVTGKWVALLMRQWDYETGTMMERCDLKCGIQSLREFNRPYLSGPVRMRGPKWAGVAFGRETEPEVVCALFDRAFHSGDQRGFTLVLDTLPAAAGSAYQSTRIPPPKRRELNGAGLFPPAGGSVKGMDPVPEIPEILRRMRHLYEYGLETPQGKAKNFYRQGTFMGDYEGEEDIPWTGTFVCYYPSYQDLTTGQLRAYFSWRRDIRRGVFREIATSAAYLYVYELLNGIGVSSPEEVLQKLKAFDAGFLDAGFGDEKMRRNIRRWMLDFAVMHDIPSDQASAYLDQELLGMDEALTVLKRPEEASDDAVFSALCTLGGKKLPVSPVLHADAGRGRRLFAAAWRCAARGYAREDQDMFTLCFGKPVTYPWHPFSNAIWIPQTAGRQTAGSERDYTLNECRSYHYHGGTWKVEAYEKMFFNRSVFEGFLHETDLRLRRYLKTGRYLKTKPDTAWMVPFIEEAIEDDRRRVEEASRPKVNVDLSGLDRIRADALLTRDSLLTEEETWTAETGDFMTENAVAENAIAETADGDAKEAFATAGEPAGTGPVFSGIALEPEYRRILTSLLRGEPEEVTGRIIREARLMPSLAADAINEAFFDEIGDNIITCEDDALALVEDYEEDLKQLLGPAI